MLGPGWPWVAREKNCWEKKAWAWLTFGRQRKKLPEKKKMLGPGWPWVAREKKLPEEKNAWAWLTLGSGEKWELRTPPPIDSVSHTEPHFKTYPAVFRSPWELIRKWYWTLLLLVINDKKGDWRQEAQSCSWGRGTVGPSRPMLQSSEGNRESRSREKLLQVRLSCPLVS